MIGYIFTPIHSYDHFNPRANSLGIVKEWRVQTEGGIFVGITNTKKEAEALARKHRKKMKAV